MTIQNQFFKKSLLLLSVFALYMTGCSSDFEGPMIQNVEKNRLSVVFRCSDHTKYDVILKKGNTPVQMNHVNLKDHKHTEVAFSKLKSGTTYDLIINKGSKTIHSGKVSTAPADVDTPFRFIAFGDSGSGSKEQYELGRKMASMNPALVIHTGDLIYPHGKATGYPDKFYKPYKDLISNAPFYPCIGNHDYSTNTGHPLLNEFALPKNGPVNQEPERHYFFDYAGVRFVAIDSDLAGEILEKDVAPWLDEILGEAPDQWKVVFFHHPMIGSAKYGPTYRLHNVIKPVLEKHQVDLVLNGHNHAYERSYPKFGDEITTPDKGIVYITTGAGGAPLYELQKNIPDEIAKRHNEKHSFTVIDVNSTKMEITQYDIDLKKIDQSSIARKTKMNIAENDPANEELNSDVIKSQGN